MINTKNVMKMLKATPTREQRLYKRQLFGYKTRYILNQYARESARQSDAVVTLGIMKHLIKQAKEALEELKSYTPAVVGRLQEDLEGDERRELERLFIEWVRLQDCIDIMDKPDPTKPEQ